MRSIAVGRVREDYQGAAIVAPKDGMEPCQGADMLRRCASFVIPMPGRF